uniref:Ovule protein n=1 Tax=Caenorhabditis tropicalis TaxID=1561998 RepID=A0A1I7TTS4_9PELO
MKKSYSFSFTLPLHISGCLGIIRNLIGSERKANGVQTQQFLSNIAHTVSKESTTAAAQVFRRNHLDSKKPIVLDAKPSVSMNNSILSQKTMAWIGKKDNVVMEMSSTFGEKKIGNHRVDGFSAPTGRD